MTLPATAPRLSRRRAAWRVMVALAAAGVPVGALWAWIAPPVHGVVALTRAGERVHTYLGNEADHFFVAAFIMLGLLSVLAVVSSVLVWQWRPHRGPVMVIALSMGLMAAAALAAAVGAPLVRWQYGGLDVAGAPVSPEHRVHYFTQAPSVLFGHTPLQVACTLLVPAAAAALTYALLAVATPRDDLGAWPPVEQPSPSPAAVTPSELPSR